MRQPFSNGPQLTKRRIACQAKSLGWSPTGKASGTTFTTIDHMLLNHSLFETKSTVKTFLNVGWAARFLGLSKGTPTTFRTMRYGISTLRKTPIKRAKDRPATRSNTYAALLIAAGQSPKNLQRQMGHGSVQITLDLSGHLYDAANREAARKTESPL